jgi:hypothetical protein
VLGPALAAEPHPAPRLRAVEAVHARPDAAVLRFSGRGGGPGVGLEISPRDESRPAFYRTRRLDVRYLEGSGDEVFSVEPAALAQAVASLVRVERQLAARRPGIG